MGETSLLRTSFSAYDERPHMVGDVPRVSSLDLTYGSRAMSEATIPRVASSDTALSRGMSDAPPPRLSSLDGNRSGGSNVTTSTTTTKYVNFGRGKPLVVQQSKKVTDKYDVKTHEVLGDGSFATVYAAVDRETGQPVAVKAINRR